MPYDLVQTQLNKVMLRNHSKSNSQWIISKRHPNSDKHFNTSDSDQNETEKQKNKMIVLFYVILQAYHSNNYIS